MSSSSHENESCQSASSHVNESCQSAYSRLQCRVLVLRVKNCVFCTRQSAVIERYAARVTQRSVTQRSVTVRVIAQRKLASRILFSVQRSSLEAIVGNLPAVFHIGSFKYCTICTLTRAGRAGRRGQEMTSLSWLGSVAGGKTSSRAGCK